MRPFFVDYEDEFETEDSDTEMEDDTTEPSSSQAEPSKPTPRSEPAMPTSARASGATASESGTTQSTSKSFDAPKPVSSSNSPGQAASIKARANFFGAPPEPIRLDPFKMFGMERKNPVRAESQTDNVASPTANTESDEATDTQVRDFLAFREWSLYSLHVKFEVGGMFIGSVQRSG